MFADDTTLIAKSRKAIGIMLREIRDTLKDVGLHMNAGKCSVQCSGRSNAGGKGTQIQYQTIPILSCNEGFKVLGTMVTMNGNADIEFEARLAAAWAKFHSLSSLLLKSDASEIRRLRLFDATVTKSALRCSETWNLTVSQKRRLRTTQRAMLRKMVAPKRRPDEDYIAWVKRGTRASEQKAERAGVSCWLKTHLRAKWRWAKKSHKMEGR